MKKFMSEYWFFIGIAIVSVIAFNFPVIGIKIKQWHLLKAGIFIAFLITGMQMKTSTIIDEIRNFKALSSAILSSLVLIPAIAYILGGIFFKNNPGFLVGTYIAAVVPATIASGTVLTAIGRGNIPLSLFICVSTNFLSIFTIPVALNILLQFGHSIDLPILKMIKSLFMIMMLPTLLGQILRIKISRAIIPFKKYFSIFSQLVVLLIIFNAVASSTDRISQLGFKIIFIFMFMILLHGIILLMNFAISRLIRLDRPSTTAFTIHTSQKTLTIAYIVWAGYFSTSFPIAMIPPIVYHLTQMIMV
ncbi:MAG: bile acid:sodium symporter [Deltaproteobacteria bacterium]|nr:bile acid:sodium symporter [Deltaproteobacteria bacterium]